MDERLRREVGRLRARSSGVRFEELARVWERAGGTVSAPRGGSHYRFRIGGRNVVVPFRRPHLKQYVVRQALELLEAELE